LHLLGELQREFRMGLILITHDLSIVVRLATRVAVMYAGQIVEAGAVDRIFRRPLHPYTRGLLACIPAPGRTRRGEPLGTIAGTVPTLIGRLTGCHFATRCPYALQPCRAAPVCLEDDVIEARSVRCLRAAELSGTATPPEAQ
jgi:peptide/nickel transport system ATP-binding protein